MENDASFVLSERLNKELIAAAPESRVYNRDGLEMLLGKSSTYQVVSVADLCYFELNDFADSHYLVDVDSLRDSNSYFDEERILGGLMKRQVERTHLTRYECYASLSSLAGFRVIYIIGQFVEGEAVYLPTPDLYPRSFTTNHGINQVALTWDLLALSGFTKEVRMPLSSPVIQLDMSVWERISLATDETSRTYQQYHHQGIWCLEEEVGDTIIEA